MRRDTAEIYPTLFYFGPYSMPMKNLASFAFLIATAECLADAVNVRDNVYLRPLMATKAVAARLKSGLIVLRAFVRRLIIAMALEMEWGLVDKRGEMKRPHGRKSTSRAALTLTAFDSRKASPWDSGYGLGFKIKTKTIDFTPQPVDMTKLYAQLDYLSKIAANPMAKAKRLAFHLARNYQGIIMAPRGPERIAGRWGTEVSASYDALACAIMTKSRSRPPPLPPPRNQWPTITVL
jgi:hypothetical protein